MKKSGTKNVSNKNERDIVDLTPKKEQNVNGGLNFTAKVSKPSPIL